MGDAHDIVLLPKHIGDAVEPPSKGLQHGLKVFLGAIVVGLAAGVFSKTVLAGIFIGAEILFRYFLTLFFMFFMIDRVFVKLRLTYLDVIIFILLLVPVYSTFSARREFGQPILTGLFAQNYLLMYVAGVFIFYLIRMRWMSIRTLHLSYLFLGWLSLLLFTYSEYFVDPSKYTELDFVRSKDAKGGLFFRYFTFFIAFTGLYHAVNFFIANKDIHLLVFLPFLFFMVVINNGRTDLVVFLSTLGIIFFKYLSIRRLLIYSFVAVVAGTIFFIAFAAAAPEEATVLWNMYSSYFTVLAGEASEDNSASSRLFQMTWATNFLVENIDAVFFGGGKVSKNFEVTGTYLFRVVNPVDIGLLGLVFSHGIVGLIIMYSQFVFVFYFISRVKHVKNDMFFITCKYSVIMIFIQSFFKGPLFYLPGQLIGLVGVLYAYRWREFDIEEEYERIAFYEALEERQKEQQLQ